MQNLQCCADKPDTGPLVFRNISEAHPLYLRHTRLLLLPSVIILLLLNILSYNPSIEYFTFAASEQRIPQYFDSKRQSIFVDLIDLLYELYFWWKILFPDY